MKLEGIKEITGKIILKSGLHIGSGNQEMKIGGTDNPVIKHPHTNEPYIPGSSLKGKIRSLLEMRSGLMVKTNGSPVSLKTLTLNINNNEKKECEKILKLFGAGASESDTSDLGSTRASFADCPLDDDWRKKASDQHLAFAEYKSENTIDRIKGTAGNPRITERVPAGVEFKFCISLKKLNSNEDELETFLLDGLKLLEMDALGGSGSRGYGKIEFKFDDEKIEQNFNNLNPFK
ncbi:MAG: type III-A CRISPR-associated RAMP protein Csm3 [Desulfobacterales bacterium]|nr:type III-A CRISPR-associated RAMP protein Csm3 [Desulfobacterales bacterium]